MGCYTPVNFRAGHGSGRNTRTLLGSLLEDYNVSYSLPCVPRKRLAGTAFVALLTAALPLLNITPAHAQTVSGIVVPGSSNPFLAGMPDGSSASGDTAPEQSPTPVIGLNLAGGGFLTFSVTGSVDFGGGSPTDPPDGSFNVGHGAENGIGGFNAPANALVGVFLTGLQPDLTAAPGDLDFTSGNSGEIGTTFASLSPQLKQVFFIGNGLTGNQFDSVQQFQIPTGATRFFLGTVDGFGWFNNSGQFDLTVTQISGSAAAPEPSALAFVGSGLSLMGLALSRRKK